MESGDDPGRIGFIGNEVQNRREHDGNGLTEVDQAANLLMAEDVIEIRQICADGRGMRGGQSGLRMADRHRVFVYVHHARIRRDLRSDLMHVLYGGQAGSDVEELRDPGVCAEAHGPAQEPAVLPC